jgi:microtubule-associated protein 1 light chain
VLTFEDRARDSAAIRDQHTNKVPVIVERPSSEKSLPILDKTKFLVPDHVTVTELIRVLRRRLNLAPGQAFFLLSDRGLPPGTQTLAELWESEHDEDGFLYVFYAAQEYFG